MEIFKDIIGYEGLYQVSNLGNVKSLSRIVKRTDGRKQELKGKALKTIKSSGGYNQCALYKDGSRRLILVHTMVSKAFISTDYRSKGLVVRHKNQVRTDDTLENLEVVSRGESLSNRKGTSDFVGVSFCNTTGLWAASIFINGKQKFLGRFKEEILAHYKHQQAVMDNIKKQIK